MRKQIKRIKERKAIARRRRQRAGSYSGESGSRGCFGVSGGYCFSFRLVLFRSFFAGFDGFAFRISSVLHLVDEGLVVFQASPSAVHTTSAAATQAS